MADLINEIVNGRLQSIRNKQNTSALAAANTVTPGISVAPAQGNWNASNSYGLISQGIGNLVGAINAPAARQEAARQEAIKAEATNYQREQDAQALALRAQTVAQGDKANALQEKRINNAATREDAALAKQNLMTAFQNNVQKGLNAAVGGFVNPIQERFARNKEIAQGIDTQYLTTDDQGNLLATEGAPASVTQALSELQSTPTGYDQKGLKNTLEKLYASVAQNAEANGLLIPNKQEFIQQGISMADSGLEFATQASKSQTADVERQNQVIMEDGTRNKERNIALANMRINSPEQFKAWNALPEDSPNRDAIVDKAVKNSAAYRNSMNQFNDSLTKLQEKGISSVEQVFGDYNSAFPDFDAKDKGESIANGSATARLAVENLRKEMPNEFTFDINDPNVLAVIEQTAKRVGPDGSGGDILGDADWDDSWNWGTTTHGTFYKELYKGLKNLPILQQVMNQNAAIDKKVSAAKTGNAKIGLLRNVGAR